MFRQLLQICLCLTLAFTIKKYLTSNYTPTSTYTTIPGLPPATYLNNQPPSVGSLPTERISFRDSVPTRLPDTTVVILNWSRLPNVINIVSTICDPSLEHIVATVFIWNNSPQKITEKDFTKAQCPKGKIRIYNSPYNMYFQARFKACAESFTTYCFIQDDDYLILPEIINALHSYISESTGPGIHLLPPHEKLSSELRTIRAGTKIHTSFAWLGHGTMIRRSQAIEFLALLQHLNISAEELDMADNYFTILCNVFPETWFDQGIELGGGQPFTVGSTGDDRNKRHINRAAQILDSIVASHGRPHDHSPNGPESLPYVTITDQMTYPRVSRSPCVGPVGVFETSINLLPADIVHDVSRADQILTHEVANSKLLVRKENPTIPTYAKEGDTLSIDVLRNIGSEWTHIELVFLVDAATARTLGLSKFEYSADRTRWITSASRVVCLDSDIVQIGTSSVLRECSVQLLSEYNLAHVGVRIFRARLEENTKENWCIYEFWVRGSRRADN